MVSPQCYNGGTEEIDMQTKKPETPSLLRALGSDRLSLLTPEQSAMLKRRAEEQFAEIVRRRESGGGAA